MKILSASVVAGLLSFAWGFVSWVLIGWHNPQPFTHPDEVAAVIRANAPARGVYMLPAATGKPADAQAAEQVLDNVRHGPHLWALIRPGSGGWSMGHNLVMSFLRSFMSSLVLAGLLMRLERRTVLRCVECGMLVGVLVGLQSDATFGIWFEAAPLHLAAMCTDHLVEGLLMGLTLGLFLRPPAPRPILDRNRRPRNPFHEGNVID